MIIFDTLDNLELYQGISDKILGLITVMDRSLPYDQGPGRYTCPEDDKIVYEIDAYPTTREGRLEMPSEREYSMEIVLEGESVTSVGSDNVFVMAPGRFLLMKGETGVKRRMTRNIYKSVKSVIFRF